MPDTAIRVAELSKIFRVPEREAGLAAALRSVFKRRWREVRAVDAISFEIEPGEVVGFLGPNGESTPSLPPHSRARYQRQPA